MQMVRSDGRIHKRVKCSIDSAFCGLYHSLSTGLIETCVNNVSEGGIAFRSNHFIPIQNQLQFRLNLNKQKPITVRIKPLWIVENPRLHQFEIGACFVDLSNEDKQFIEDMVDSYTVLR